MSVEYVTLQDSEAELVRALDVALKTMGRNDVRVATRRLPDDHPVSVPAEVILRSNGKMIRNNVSVEEDFTIYVFYQGSNESTAHYEANKLSNEVAGAIRLAVAESKFFRAQMGGPSMSIEDDIGTTQVRSVLVTLLSYGTRNRISNKE